MCAICVKSCQEDRLFLQHDSVQPQVLWHTKNDAHDFSGGIDAVHHGHRKVRDDTVGSAFPEHLCAGHQSLLRKPENRSRVRDVYGQGYRFVVVRTAASMARKEKTYVPELITALLEALRHMQENKLVPANDPTVED